METTMKNQTLEEIRAAGMEVLRQHLGIVGMIRFLQYHERGYGNYSKERHEWLGEKSIKEIADEIKKIKK